ncbi:MAG: RagB/SusD family nutrient uptake outer membrane protein [Odoribacteraceae bacterium]|jgi:hypothetical protein|nr:RagB/SusD family nutrient uptake outer membrane protein [Odoribacteraceae bacterium]
MNRFILILSILALTSCNDWLEVRPRTELAADEMFASESGFKDALTACYIQLNSTNLYGSRLIVMDIEYLANHWDTDNPLDAPSPLKNFEYELARESILTIYLALYNVIAQANTVLENLPATGQVIRAESTRAIIEAEALAIRAFCHFEILRLFGQVPQNATKLVSLPYAEVVSLDAIPFYPFDAFVAKISRDWEKAEALLQQHDPVLEYSYDQLDYVDTSIPVALDDAFLGYRRFRFNYHAVKALQARMYLYTGQREKAYTTARALIDARDKAGNKVISLAGNDDYNQKYYALPTECLLALNNFQLSAIHAVYFSDNNPWLFVTADHFNEIFTGQSTASHNRAIGAWIRSGLYLTLRKYEQPGTSETVSSNLLATRRQVVPLIRLSEIYLIAMETAPDNTVFNTLYAEYLIARNVTPITLTDDQVMTEITREYRREFFGEGQMFYTYKRLGAPTMLWKDRFVTETNYIVPLPTSEYNSNN